MQVLFEESPDSLTEYVLIQRHFEPPDNGECYIETSDSAFCGHYPVHYAQLSRNRFLLLLANAPAKEVAIFFKATEPDYTEVKRVLRLMIPNLDLT